MSPITDSPNRADKLLERIQLRSSPSHGFQPFVARIPLGSLHQNGVVAQDLRLELVVDHHGARRFRSLPDLSAHSATAHPAGERLSRMSSTHCPVHRRLAPRGMVSTASPWRIPARHAPS